MNAVIEGYRIYDDHRDMLFTDPHEQIHVIAVPIPLIEIPQLLEDCSFVDAGSEVAAQNRRHEGSEFYLTVRDLFWQKVLNTTEKHSQGWILPEPLHLQNKLCLRPEIVGIDERDHVA